MEISKNYEVSQSQSQTRKEKCVLADIWMIWAVQTLGLDNKSTTIYVAIDTQYQ